MGASRTSFAKLQRDRAKKAKAAAKRERRQSGKSRLELEGERVGADDEVEADGAEMPEIRAGQEISASDLLVMVETLHKQFDNEEISFEEFEEKKLELMEQLTVD